MRSPRFSHLTLEIAAWIETGTWRANADAGQRGLCERPVRALAADVLGRHYRKIVKQGRDLATLEPEARHRLRIRAKKLRYAGDFFASLYDGQAAKRLDRLTRALSAFQDGLGALNDITVGAQLVTMLVGAAPAEGAKRKSDPAAAFAAGQVCAARSASAPDTLKSAHKTWRALAAAKPYW